DLLPIHEEPGVVLTAEGGSFAVLELRSLEAVAGDELDRPLELLGRSSLHAEQLEAEPLRLLRPLLGALAIHLVHRVGIVGLQDVVHVALGEGGVPGAHELLGAARLLLPRGEGTTAGLEGFAFSAGTRHVDGSPREEMPPLDGWLSVLRARRRVARECHRTRRSTRPRWCRLARPRSPGAARCRRGSRRRRPPCRARAGCPPARGCRASRRRGAPGGLRAPA